MYADSSSGPGPALMGADTLLGNDVHNKDGESLGDIKEFMIDMASGRNVETAALVASLRTFVREVLDLDEFPADVSPPKQGPLRPAGVSSRAGRGERAGGTAAGRTGGQAGDGAGTGALGPSRGLGLEQRSQADLLIPRGRVAWDSRPAARIDNRWPAAMSRRRHSKPRVQRLQTICSLRPRAQRAILVADLVRNPWRDRMGKGGRFGSESLASLVRNTHPSQGAQRKGSRAA